MLSKLNLSSLKIEKTYSRCNYKNDSSYESLDKLFYS